MFSTKDADDSTLGETALTDQLHVLLYIVRIHGPIRVVL